MRNRNFSAFLHGGDLQECRVPAGANQKKRRDLLDSIASTEQNSVQLSVEIHSNRSSESFSESELDGIVRGNERGSLSELPVSDSDSCSSS